MEQLQSCPSCQSPLRIVKGKEGKYESFMGCANYPECKYTKKIGEDKPSKTQIAPKEPVKGLSVGQILALLLEHAQDTKKIAEETREMLEEYMLSLGHEKKKR